MKILKKLKSSNFWISMISAVVLILQAVFNVEIKTEYLNQIIMSILGLLVMSGIVTDVGSEDSSNNGSNKKDVDIEDLKKDITTIITQLTSTFENGVIDIVKQFKDSEQASSVKNVSVVTQDDDIDKSKEVFDAVSNENENSSLYSLSEIQNNVESSIENQNVQ